MKPPKLTHLKYVRLVFFTAGLSLLCLNSSAAETPIIREDVVNLLVKQLEKRGETTTREEIVDELETMAVLRQAAYDLELDKTSGLGAVLELESLSRLSNAYIEHFSRNLIANITLEQLQKEYDKYQSGAQETEYNVSHILLDDEELTERIIDELKTGISFEDAAYIYSEDSSSVKEGRLGWFKIDSMDPAFTVSLESLEVGQYTKKPVKSDFGWHIIKLNQKRSVNTFTFEALKEKMTQKIVTQELNEHLLALKRSSGS